jgi:hypothetical protein
MTLTYVPDGAQIVGSYGGTPLALICDALGRQIVVAGDSSTPQLIGGLSRDVVDIVGDINGVKSAWALTDLSSAVTLLAASMDGQPPAPAKLVFTVTTAPGGAGETTKKYSFLTTGIDENGDAQTETTDITADALTATTTKYWRASLTSVVASRAVTTNNPGATTIGWAATAQWKVPTGCTAFDLLVDGVGVYADLSAIPAVGANDSVYRAAFHWASGGGMTGWGLAAGTTIYFLADDTATAGDCVRISRYE